MDQLIEIWQTVHTDQRNMDRKYKPKDLIPQVIKLEKNQKKVLLFKTYGSISILFMVLIIFFSQFNLVLNSILGIGVITASILGSVILLNRLRFRITDEERSLCTNTLVEVLETKIKSERKLFTLFLPIILLFIILGINLMYLEFLTELETRTRIIYHIMLTISMIVAFFLGLSIRIKRYKKRFLPLLNRIQKFKSTVTQ
jgi:hypothetical protein